MTTEENARIRWEQKVNDALEQLSKNVCDIKTDIAASRKENIAILETFARKNTKRNNWILASFLSAIIVMFVAIISYVNIERSNVASHEQLQAQIDKKAARSKLNFAASWQLVCDSNKQRAKAYYDIIIEPSDITRGAKEN